MASIILERKKHGRTRSLFRAGQKKWAITLTELQRSSVLMGKRSNPWLQVPWLKLYGTAMGWGKAERGRNLIQSTQELRQGKRFFFQWDKDPWAKPRTILCIFLSGPVRPLAWTQFSIFLERPNYGCLPMVPLPADGTKLNQSKRSE